jgi:tetratricopeptide (TPR) repeat protein
MADDRRRGDDRSGDRAGRPPAKRRGVSGRGAPGSGAARKASGSSGTGRGQSGRAKPAGRGRDDRRERDAAPKRGGGFGPYQVDSRDEETRERRNRRSWPAGEQRDDRGGRPALRTVGQRPDRDTKSSTGTRKARPAAPARRRRKRGPADVQQEIGKLAGRNANRALGTLMAAADAFANDREREALRILRPLREQLPDSPSVRELAGLCQYRIGNYAAAAKELEAYADLSDSVDQHPVLMDCYRAQRRWRKVDDLWEELAAVSPSAELVTEGRIVYAGALADQGRLPEALSVLRKRAERIKKPSDHQLRLLYALADLEERAGNLARARELFHQVRRSDAAFADVAERLAALG